MRVKGKGQTLNGKTKNHLAKKRCWLTEKWKLQKRVLLSETGFNSSPFSPGNQTTLNKNHFKTFRSFHEQLKMAQPQNLDTKY